jgi:hypothetical protein
MIIYHRTKIIHNIDDRKDMKHYHTEFCEFPTVEWRSIMQQVYRKPSLTIFLILANSQLV